MATITIRNLDDSIKRRLRVQAASHNHSMEEEARIILKKAVQSTESSGGLGSRIHERFKELGGIDIPEAHRAERPRKAKVD
jgi:plasmid stability protein